jgi:Amt family ammonium transporter
LAEASVVRKQFAPYIIVKNLVIIGLGLTVWWLLGYGFAFENTSSDFIGEEKFSGEDWEGKDAYIRAALYGMVGLSTVLSVSAALSERVQPNAMFAYTLITMIFTWPVVVAWGWGNGWLNSKFDGDFIDTGGACTIHVFAGTSSLVALAIYGKRKDRYETEPRVPPFEPSSSLSVYLAAMFIVLAMIAFHPASAGDTQEIGHAIFNTLLGGSTGCLVAWVGALIAGDSVIFHLYSIIGGFLSGCIVVSSIVQNIEAWAAFVVGFLGGLLFIVVFAVGRRAKLDDAVSIVPVQLLSGALGTILVGFFDDKEGVFHKSDGNTLGIQILGLVVIAAWAAFWSAIIFGLSRLLRQTIPDVLQGAGLELAELGWFGFQPSKALKETDQFAGVMTTRENFTAKEEMELAKSHHN